MKAVLSVLLFGFALIAAQTEFSGRVVINARPGMVGAISGNFYYHAGVQAMRIDLDVGATEIYRYDTKLRYLQCGQTCETETWNSPLPRLFHEGEGANGATFGACTGFSKPGGAPTIFINGAGQVCRAIFQDGSVYDFSNWAPVDPAVFAPLGNCPQPVCTKRIDFGLVFDESGSINGNDFRREQNFAQDFAKAFTWGPDYIGMSLTMFSNSARLIIGLDYSPAAFIQAVGNVRQSQGSTCIGCGIATSFSNLNGAGRYIPGTNTRVSRVIIVLTDGQNNVGSYQGILNQAKNDGVIFFSIGIGSVSQAQINEIGSDLPGVTTRFYGTDFSALPGILNGLVTATCSNIPGNPCGTGCIGYCSCGKTCVCPNLCDDGNACTDNKCTPGVNGNGCYFPPISCDDGNACTSDGCNPGSGCFHNPVNCDDSNVCTTDTCDPRIGCNNAQITCADLSPCTADSCNPSSGCTFTPIPNCPAVCSDPTKPIVCPHINCTKNECDVSRNGQCTATPIVCDDNNKCTIDTCNAKTDSCVFTPKNCDDNNKCTTDYCDLNTGNCVNQPINATAVCNDYNACTRDVCIPATGCANTPIVCNDNNVCTQDKCSTATGCYYPPVDCWKEDPDLVTHPDLIGCFSAYCNATANRGCVLTPINGSAIDSCGICNGDGSSCLGQLDSGVATGLGAGAVAGIVIGVVGVAAVLGVLGGKKGYDIWLKHRANMQGANTNPLYTHNGLSGSNPMYNADQGA